MSAFPLRPGVSKKKFYPTGLENLEKEMGLKLTGTNQAKKTEANTDTIDINNNNIVFDGPTTPSEEVPFVYVNDV